MTSNYPITIDLHRERKFEKISGNIMYDGNILIKIALPHKNADDFTIGIARNQHYVQKF